MFGFKHKKKDLVEKLLESKEASIFKQVAINEAMSEIEASHKEDYEFMKYSLNKSLIDINDYSCTGSIDGIRYDVSTEKTEYILTTDNGNTITINPYLDTGLVPSMYAVCTYKEYLEQAKNYPGSIFYISDLNQLYYNGQPLLSEDDNKEEEKSYLKVRVTNCKCCGARLPYTDNDFVTCEYCDSIQNTFDIKKF